MSPQPDSRTAAARPPAGRPRHRVLVAVLVVAGAFILVAGATLLSIAIMQLAGYQPVSLACHPGPPRRRRYQRTASVAPARAKAMPSASSSPFQAAPSNAFPPK